LESRLHFAITRANRIEEYQNKSNTALNLNVFDHKNIYYDTKITHSTCSTIKENDFVKFIKFECGIPHLVNDFIKYITDWTVDLQGNNRRQEQRTKFLEKVSSGTSNKHQNHQFLIKYTQEDLNSTKFWGLLEHYIEKPKEDGTVVLLTEAQSHENKNKRSHTLPLEHALLPFKDFLQYISKTHIKHLEK